MNVDVALIANHLGGLYQSNFYKFLGNPINNLFFKPLFINYNESNIALVTIDTNSDECISKKGIVKARKQFLQSLIYAVEELNVKILLLAASTKRLFGKDIELRVNWEGISDNNGFTLQELYPELLFTNGDNGTAIVLEMEINSILEKENIIPEKENLCNHLNNGHQCSGSVVINGLGLLGTNSLLHLIENQFCDKQVIVISNHSKDLDNIIGRKDVKVFSHISKIQDHCCMGSKNHVKMIVNCTHHPAQMITAENISHIQNGQKVNVIDVAIPYGFPEEEFLKCHNVYRQDGGNAFIENGLNFWFNPAMCGLKENVLYGCFAESVALSLYLKENPEAINNIRELDFFNVNTQAKFFIKGLFDKHGIGIAETPFNFNKRIEN